MHAVARAQPNFALIKYWGKRDPARNLPAVGSLSVTLADLYTEMSVEFDPRHSRDELVVNGARDEVMLQRVSDCLSAVAGDGRASARVESRANFPLSAGLASSAAAFAALVVAADRAAGQQRSTAQLASLAGRASGSAARSLYGGFVELGNDGDDIRVQSILDAAAWPLAVVIAVTAPGPKPVGSGDAMEISRRTSPFYSRWVDEQPNDLAVARSAVAARDFDELGAVAEHNCLKMHSVMWTSRPPIVYWNAATLACLERIRHLRARGTGVFFTIDAGPQVKAVCEPGAVETVRASLADTPGVASVMSSGLGGGARLIS
ncbi:MAG: diphosphomevalonate decarboxylase [Woeseiaceae bacterium]|nr:diphosphomevalonate decarboxylase [Woeseiaceae bacterium]